jgi:hypothetical protein
MKSLIYIFTFTLSILSCKVDDKIDITPYDLTNTISTEDRVWVSVVNQKNSQISHLYSYNFKTKIHRKINFKNLNIIPQKILNGTTFNSANYIILQCLDTKQEYKTAYYLLKILENDSVEIVIKLSENLNKSPRFDIKVFSESLYLHDRINSEIFLIKKDNSSKLIYKQLSQITDFYIIQQGLLIISSDNIIIQNDSAQQIFQVKNESVSNSLDEVGSPRFHSVTNGILINYHNKLIGYNTRKSEIEFIRNGVNGLMKTNQRSFYTVENSNLVEYNDDLTLKKKTNINGFLLFADDKYIFSSSNQQSLPIKIFSKSISDSTQKDNFQLDFYGNYLYASYKASLNDKWYNFEKYKYYTIIGNQIIFSNLDENIIYLNGKLHKIPSTQLLNMDNSVISIELNDNKIQLFREPFTTKQIFYEFNL